MYKILMLFAASWLYIAGTVWGQEIPVVESFPLDDSVFTEIEAVELYGAPLGLKDEPLKKVSFRALAPPVGDMGKSPAGLSLTWAITYYATAITFRLKPSEALSPYFLFDMLSNAKCQLPKTNYMAEIKRILLEVGSLRNSDYKPGRDCFKRPDLSKYENAPRYRVTLNTILAAKPGQGLSSGAVLYAVRRTLDEGHPVIGIMKADNSFRQLRTGAWQPDNSADLFTHAVVIVGYDNKTEEVEVVNCWGKSWGIGGFGRIKYKDLYFFKQLYQVTKLTDFAIAKITRKPTPSSPTDFTPHANPQPTLPVTQKPTVPEVAPKPTMFNLYGSLRLRIPVGQSENGKVLFEDVNYSNVNGICQATQPTQWPIGQQFQLLINQLTPESYLYLFSIDPKGVATIHWPQKASLGNLVSTPFSALVVGKQTSFVLPRPRPIEENNKLIWQDRAFTKDAEGTDHLVMLHSSEELSDQEFLEMVTSLKGQHNSNELLTSINKVLADRLISDPIIKTNTNQIQYSAKTNTGYVVPVVLKID